MARDHPIPELKQWYIDQKIANLYLEKGDPGKARLFGNHALQNAPPHAMAQIKQFLSRIPED